MQSIRGCVIGAAAALALVACEDRSSSPAAGVETAAPTAPTAEIRPAESRPAEPSPGAAATPTPHPPVGGTPTAEIPRIEFDAATRSSLRFAAPEGWIEQKPSSSMRVAQFALPGEAGEATLVVYFFGAGGAGGVEANLVRWCGQFEVPGGGDPREAAETGERTINGMTVHDVELAGTYVAETTPGSGQRLNQPLWRLRGSILATDGGPYYVKLIGPDETVRAHAEAYEAFVESAGGG